MAISDKLNYLIETKSQLKETINYAGAGLTDETFRQYPSKLYDKYLDILKDNGEALFNGLPKELSSGTSLSMNNTANTRMKMSLAPSELEQTTTTGKNLFDKDNANILNALINTSNNTLKADNDAKILYIPCKPNATYTISKTASSRFIVCFTDTLPSAGTSVTNIVINHSATSITNTSSANSHYIVVYYFLNGVDTKTQQEILNSIQIEEGSTATSYEPYTGGIASPNPDYPQDIHTISGDNEIKVGNKNLATDTFNDYFKITASGSNRLLETSTYKTSQVIKVKPSTTYVIDGDFSVFADGVCRARAFNSYPQLGVIDTSTAFAYKSSRFTITTDNTTNYLMIYNSQDIANIVVPNMFVCEEQYATTYVSHQEQTLPLTLGTLEYCKIGNYVDEFYLATASDTSLVAGKWYLKKNIGKITLTGTETGWVKGNDLNNNSYYYTNHYDNVIKAQTQTITSICNRFGVVLQATDVSLNNLYISTGASHLRIYIDKNIMSGTANDFKTWLTTNEVTFYHWLLTPTYTLLNDTLQEELTNIYNKALSYQDQTNISQVNDDLPFVISASAIAKYDLNETE